MISSFAHGWRYASDMAVAAPASSTPDYRALFHASIRRGVTALLEAVRQAADDLDAATRDQAWQMLDYGLGLPEAWPPARDLVLTLTPIMERAGWRMEWLPYLERAARAAAVADDPSAAELARNCGRLLRLRGDYAAAATWLAAAQARATAQADTRTQALIYNELAHLARLQSRPTEAEDHAHTALTLLGEDDPERAMSLHLLGTLAHDRHAWDESVAYHRRAHEIWLAVGDRRRAAWTLQNWGNTLRRMGQLDQAAAVVQEAIVLLGAARDPANQAIARMGLGLIAMLQGRPHVAHALFCLAEEALRRAQDDTHLATVLHNQAMNYREMAEWRAAEVAAREASTLWQALGNATMMANALDELGLAQLAQDDVAGALASLEQAAQLLTAAPPGPMVEMLWAEIGSHLEEARQRWAAQG